MISCGVQVNFMVRQVSKELIFEAKYSFTWQNQNLEYLSFRGLNLKKSYRPEFLDL